MPQDQVNDPTTCPNPTCRSTTFDTYDEERSDTRLILKRACDECDYAWEDWFKLEFDQRTAVQSG